MTAFAAKLAELASQLQGVEMELDIAETAMAEARTVYETEKQQLEKKLEKVQREFDERRHRFESLSRTRNDLIGEVKKLAEGQICPAERFPVATRELIQKSVDSLELMVRTTNCLKAENLYFVGDVVTKTETELLRTPNLGRKGLNELKEALTARGLYLGMDLAGVWPELRRDFVT